MPRDNLRKGRKSIAGTACHITICTNNHQPRFDNLYAGRIAIKHLRKLHNEENIQLITWVIMPDHAHLLFQLGQHYDLSEVIKRFKGGSAIELNSHLRRKGKFWQAGFYDHAVRKEEDLKSISRYIIANPLRAGLVQNIGDYPLWDAIWL